MNLFSIQPSCTIGASAPAGGKLDQALHNFVLQGPRKGLVHGPEVPAYTFSDRQHDIILRGICQQPS